MGANPRPRSPLTRTHIHRIQLTLEVLTPALVGGPQPGILDPTTPLRVPSLRGAWRYWFRAAAASLLWIPKGDPRGETAMLDALREIEARIFGDTQARSPLILLPPKQIAGPPLPGRLQKPGNESGLRYLGYGPFDRKDGRPPECIPEGARFVLPCRLRSPLGHEGPEDPFLRVLLATIWTWSVFGGLGGRVRRGFGSFALDLGVDPQDRASAPDLQPLLDRWQAHVPSGAAAVEGADGVLSRLQRGIGAVQDAFMALFGDRRLAFGDLRRLLDPQETRPHPGVRSLDGIANLHALRGTFPDGTAALEHLGTLFRGYRSSLERAKAQQRPLPDYFGVKHALQSGTAPRTVGRAAFGLPLRFYFRSLQGRSALLKPIRPGDRKPEERLASPLWLRVCKLQDQRRAVLLTNLAGKTTAPPLQGFELELREPRGITLRIAAPSSQELEEFMRWAAAQPPPRDPPPGSTPGNRRRNRR